MQAIEIILLLCGALAFVISFFLPDRAESEENPGISPEEVRAMVEDEIAASKDRIEDMTEETMNYALEKAERSLDRISNEKMLAFGEYSDSVLDQIGKNQQESVFLHDMLNKNKDELTELLNRADSASKDASLRANEAYDLAGSAKALAQEAYDQAENAGHHASVAEERMIDARKRLDTPVSMPEPRAFRAVAEETEVTADDVIARAQSAAALHRQCVAAVVPEPAYEEETEEAEGYDEPEAYDTDGDEEFVPHRMTALERIAALKSRPEPEGPVVMQAEPEETAADVVVPSEEQVIETVASEDMKESAAPVVSEEIPTQQDAESEAERLLENMKAEPAAAAEPETVKEVPAKPKAKRAPRKTAAKKSSGQMSLQDLMPQEPVALQFTPGGGPVNNNQKILEMHKMGRSNMAIAKELGLGLGEVKLVIDLFENS